MLFRAFCLRRAAVFAEVGACNPIPKGLLMRCNKVSLAFCLLGVLASLFLLAGSGAQAQNVRTVLITQSVDESKLVTLTGNTRPEARAEYDRGLVANNLPMEHMLLQLKRSPEQERELRQLIDELTDSSSPNFHQWLSAKEFGERFGLAAQDLDAVTRWLQSHGFKVNVVYENGLLIDFSGTAGEVRQAFRTEIHRLDVKGEKHIANMSDPQIPAALAPAVAGVVSLHDFMPHTTYRPRGNYTYSFNGQTYYAVVPADLATIYNLNPLFSAGNSGQGQTVVLVEDSDVYATSDWDTFRAVFGLSSYTEGSFTQVHPVPPPPSGSNCTDPGVTGDDAEATLDAEWASVAAPSATIELASCANTNTTFGGLIALQNLLNGSAPPALVSISYGECEVGAGASGNLAYNMAYQQAVTEGVSVFVSTGDDGASSCSVQQYYATYGIGASGLASTPYNVAVGGTDFGDSYAGTNSIYWSSTNTSTYGSALSYIPEIPWNDSCASYLLAKSFGYDQTFGSSGFCNSSTGQDSYLNLSAGSGGPSGCATGTPTTSGVVSGTCAGYAKPSWQSLVGNPNDGVRDIPDVALFAANGVWGHYYPICITDPSYGYTCTGTPDQWAGAGGTSFATPIMAGIQALVNQRAGGRQGNPNPTYYSLAASEFGANGDSSCDSTLGNAAGSSCIFYDVTQGDMDTPCVGTYNCYTPNGILGVLSTSNSAYQPTNGSDGGAYVATTGWDFATGIGTVNAFNLVNNWPGALPITNTTVTSSQNPASRSVEVTFTATVTTTGTTPPTGNVTFNDGATVIGTGTLTVSQVATFTTSTLAGGTHSITAAYGGDANNGPSTSPVLTQTITLPSTTMTLTANASTIPSGASGTFTATVTGANPTGTVTFYNGAQVPANMLGTGTLDNTGTATLTTTALVTIGVSSISAVYAGDANNLGSSSNVFTETVTASAFTMSAVPAMQTIPSGGAATIPITITPQGIYTSPITFTATLTPALSGAQISFSPPTITPNGGPAATTLTITGATAAAISGRARAANGAVLLPQRNGLKLSALNASALGIPIGLAGICFLGQRKKYGRRVAAQFLLAVALVVIALTMLGCGSSGSGSQRGQTYQVQITATAAASGNSEAVTTTTTVAFTVQ